MFCVRRQLSRLPRDRAPSCPQESPGAQVERCSSRRCATWCSSTVGKEDLSLLKRKIEWESDGTDDYGNQRVSVASFFDGCLMTLVDEVERTGSQASPWCVI